MAIPLRQAGARFLDSPFLHAIERGPKKLDYIAASPISDCGVTTSRDFLANQPINKSANGRIFNSVMPSIRE